jgi:acetolactate synthase-1/2/3 large subunit
MRSTGIRLADFVANFCAEDLQATAVFTVTGGGAMYLNDAFGKHPKLSIVPMHHEQSAAMAAEGYYRETGRIAVCQITTGPGGTNTITGCAGAWVDSEAVLFISGQVESISIAAVGNRQTGVQELDIVSLVKPITKRSLRLRDPYMIRYELEKMADLATSGRPGPVWLDIPLDLQNFVFNEVDSLPRYLRPIEDQRIKSLQRTKFKKVTELLKSAKRPILLIGNGARSAKSTLHQFLQRANVPVITGWNARDLVSNDRKLLGSAGLFGNRAANLAIQKADLVLGLGYRFSVPQTGYDPSCYAPQATIISVEVDPAELNKIGSFVDVPVLSSVAEFLEYFQVANVDPFLTISPGWLQFCNYLIQRKFDPRPNSREIINSFDFNGVLEKYLRNDDTVVTDMGTSFTCTHQDLALTSGAKLFTSSGVAAMGFGLPGALGASLTKKAGRTVLITGDGGLMFNLQELQTLVTFQANVKILIYENGGYLTMKHMQEARFKSLVGADENSHLQCPDFVKVGTAFGIDSRAARSPSELITKMDWLMDESIGPKLLVLHIDPWQPLVPRVQTRSNSSGQLFPPSLDQMFPFLTPEAATEIEEEFQRIDSVCE